MNTERSEMRRVLFCSVLLYLFLSGPISAHAAGFSSGDILVSLTNGGVQIRAADGTLKTTLDAGITGQAKGMTVTSSGDLLVSYWSSADMSSGNAVLRFHSDGTLAGAFGSGYSCNPSGIVIDNSGNVYVGQAGCSGDILKFDSAGNLLQAYNVATEAGGARWLDLDATGCVLFYTSTGLNISRYNVCTNTQLSNFNAAPFATGSAALGLRVLPDGGVIVSTTTQLVRLDSNGNVVSVYDAVGENAFATVFLDKVGHSFWTGSYGTGNVYQFDIQTGAILASFNIGIENVGAKSVLVVPAQEGPPPPPPPAPAEGRMTGGGNFVATGGIVVHHGFQLRCSVTDPRQNLEINWGNGRRFHLETVTAVTCSDDPAIDPEHPAAPIDTLVLSGTGRLNGRTTATIQLTFTDAGEPGVNDGVTMTIKDGQGNIVLDVPTTTLSLGGNHQAHRATGVEF